MKWWQNTTIYQIYPRSFKDSNNDGVGDLKGIIEKLDYLKELGIETIWLSPFYKTSHKDFGYDICDYYKVDPLFGSDEDVDILISEVHNRGLKIVFDMVMNHTSDEHEWFKESRSSKVNEKRDWYIWKKGNGKKPPNNWISMIGKKGWNYDKLTDEWYYASFLPFQPDLNYSNEEVKQEMFNVVRYWLKKGVDGFRLDIFNCIGKDKLFRNNPPSLRYIPSPDNNDEAFFQKKKYSFNHEKSFLFSKELRRVVNEFDDRFLIGEVSGPTSVLKRFMGKKNDGLHTVFLFELIRYNFNASYFKKIIEKFEKHYPKPYSPTYVYSNHDLGRAIARVDDNMIKAKLLALFQMTARGIPVLYYGEEIGMKNHDLSAHEALDPLSREYKWIPKKLFRSFKVLTNRDDSRTPMQWDESKNSDFSDENVASWLPLTKGFRKRNVHVELDDDDSILNFYKNILNYRKNSKILKEGDIVINEKYTTKDILVFERILNEKTLMIVINFSKKKYALKKIIGKIQIRTKKKIVLSKEKLLLPKFSGCIIEKHMKA